MSMYPKNMYFTSESVTEGASEIMDYGGNTVLLLAQPDLNNAKAPALVRLYGRNDI